MSFLYYTLVEEATRTEVLVSGNPVLAVECVGTAAQGSPCSGTASLSSLACSSLAFNEGVASARVSLPGLRSAGVVSNSPLITGTATLPALSARANMAQIYPMTCLTNLPQLGVFGIAFPSYVATGLSAIGNVYANSSWLLANSTQWYANSSNYAFGISAIGSARFENSAAVANSLSITATATLRNAAPAQARATLRLSAVGSGQQNDAAQSTVVLLQLYTTSVATLSQGVSATAALPVLRVLALAETRACAGVANVPTLAAGGLLGQAAGASAGISLPSLTAAALAAQVSGATGLASLPPLTAVAFARQDARGVATITLQAVAVAVGEDPASATVPIAQLFSTSAMTLFTNAAAISTLSVGGAGVVFIPGNVNASASTTLPGLTVSSFVVLSPPVSASALVALPTLTAVGSIILHDDASAQVAVPTIAASGSVLNSNLVSANIAVPTLAASSALLLYREAAALGSRLSIWSASGTASLGLPFGVVTLPALTASGTLGQEQFAATSATLAWTASGSVAATIAATTVATLAVRATATLTPNISAQGNASLGVLTATGSALATNAASAVVALPGLAVSSSADTPLAASATNTLQLGVVAAVQNNLGASGVVNLDFLAAYGLLFNIDPTIESEEIIYFDN